MTSGTSYSGVLIGKGTEPRQLETIGEILLELISSGYPSVLAGIQVYAIGFG